MNANGGWLGASMVTSLLDAVRKSLVPVDIGSHDARFDVVVNGEVWACYEISVSHQDVMLYCDKGCATIVVDSRRDNFVLGYELFDWERYEDI